MRAVKGSRKARAEGKGTPELVGVEIDTAATVRQRRPKLGQPGAFCIGILGAHERGDQGLSVGTNGASIGVVNLRESKWEGS